MLGRLFTTSAYLHWPRCAKEDSTYASKWREFLKDKQDVNVSHTAFGNIRLDPMNSKETNDGSTVVEGVVNARQVTSDSQRYDDGRYVSVYCFQHITKSNEISAFLFSFQQSLFRGE